MDVQTGAGGQAKVDLTAIVGDLIPAADDTSELGSATNRWAAAFIILLAITTSITIGGVVKLSTTDSWLFINASTWINESLNVSGNITASNITADYFFGNGSQLTDISVTETDPKWTGNVSNVAFTNIDEVFDESVNITGNLTLTTANYCIIFDSGGKICSGV